jgi:hypothetical protein
MELLGREIKSGLQAGDGHLRYGSLKPSVAGKTGGAARKTGPLTDLNGR